MIIKRGEERLDWAGFVFRCVLLFFVFVRSFMLFLVRDVFFFCSVVF